MATLTISLTGSAVVTGSKTYTVNDADIQSILDWTVDTNGPLIQKLFDPNFGSTTPHPPIVPTKPQIMMTWVQDWINTTKVGVRRFKTPVPVVPPEIGVS